VVTPDRRIIGAAVLIHGGGATRDEGGFFTRIAAGLAEVGVASLRFDLRGHGESEGRQEDLTICGVVNDIRAAVDHIRQQVKAEAVGSLAPALGAASPPSSLRDTRIAYKVSCCSTRC